MSATLVARGLAAGHGARSLFSDLDLVVNPGDVVGLVGANGAGKTTLLRLLAGELAPESGAVTLTPPGAVAGYLPQTTTTDSGEQVAELLARRTGVAAADDALTRAADGLANGRPGADDAYAAALDAWTLSGAADLTERAEAALATVAPGIEPGRQVATLSGGQVARVGLVGLLLARFDLFCLDEPTNDLDLDGLDRLERFVTGQRAGVVVVSHDREFLARTTTTVVELDLAQQQVSVFGGGYAAYLEEREVARQHAREAYDDFADTRAGLQARARTQRGWMDKGVRNVIRKGDPDKNIRHKHREGSEKQAAKARQTERMIERLDVVAEPRKEWQLRMSIASAPRSGQVVAALRGVTVRRGAFSLGPVDLQVDWADRVALTGPNGSGKTTLLDLLLGRLPPDAGEAYLGPGVVVGEIDQARGLLETGDRLLDAFRTHVPDDDPAQVRTLLAKFGLAADHVARPVATLSPGERTRAALALLQARGVNLLVLDEPTNHLDLPAIEQLEQALDSFGGTVLLVTHDRAMLAAVRTDRHLEMDAGRVRERSAHR